jgi:hypothetical protein
LAKGRLLGEDEVPEVEMVPEQEQLALKEAFK